MTDNQAAHDNLAAAIADEIAYYERRLTAYTEVYNRYSDATPGHNPDTGRDHLQEAMSAAASITALNEVVERLRNILAGTPNPPGHTNGELRDLSTRIRAVLRLISPDHITPIGVRQIESVLPAAPETGGTR